MAVLEPTNATEKRPTRHSKSSARSAAWLLRGFKRQKHYYHYFTTCELRTPRPGLLSPAALKRKHIVNSWPLLRPSSPSLRKALPRVACARDTSAGCGSPVVNAKGTRTYSHLIMRQPWPLLTSLRDLCLQICAVVRRDHMLQQICMASSCWSCFSIQGTALFTTTSVPTFSNLTARRRHTVLCSRHCSLRQALKIFTGEARSRAGRAGFCCVCSLISHRI